MARTVSTPTTRDLDVPTELADLDDEEMDDEQTRIYKARSEAMLVLPETTGERLDTGYPTGLYHVVRPSGSVYVVDLEAAVPTCTCPDYVHNTAPKGLFCKHGYHVMRAVRETNLPAPEAADWAYPTEDVLALLKDWWADIDESDHRDLRRVVGDHPAADWL